MKTPVVLLFGFGPFGGEDVNPAQDVVRELAGVRFGGQRVVPGELAVAFVGVLAALSDAIAREQPAIVIGVGQAGGRARIAIERVAINLIDARIADNAGAQPIDAVVIEGAPAAYFTTLPVKAMLSAMQSAGVPAELSFSAGSYVCNAAFFALMHLLATQHRGMRGGFIHIPYLPRQAAAHAGAPSMELGTLSKGIGIAIEAALLSDGDLRFAGGETH